MARSNEGADGGDVDLTTVNGNVHFNARRVGDGRRALRHDDGQLSSSPSRPSTSPTRSRPELHNFLPGHHQPMDGQRRGVQDGHGMYQYYLKVVPTVYK